jgi:iron(III) transport system substrate-binding protein
MEALESKGLAEPTSPNPKTSGTGYMFLKSLVNAWGEDEAFSYFDKFANQVLEFTSSGSGPVNALVQGEVVVGLGMTAQAVTQISAGAPLKVIYFEEGSPYTGYGAAIIEGKQGRHEVKEVFDFFYNYLIYEDKELFFPEQIYKDITLAIENYPVDIPYADMAGNTTEERIRLLEMWEY